MLLLCPATCDNCRDAAVAAAVAALKSLKIPRVSLEPETDKISVTEGTGQAEAYAS